MFIDLYSVRIQALVVAWIVSCVGFYFLIPHIARLIPQVSISPVSGIVGASVFFGWQLWRALKAGPKDGELQWVDQS